MEIFFPLVWPIVHPCPVKTVSGNASFQITLQSRNFRKRRLLDSCRWRKNEYVEVLDPRSYPAHEMRRNAHAPIKEGTAFSHYCIFVWTGKKRFKNAKWEEKRRKKSPLSNKNGYVWTGTNWVKKLNDMLFDNIHTFPLPRDGLTFCLNFQHSTDDHNPEDESEKHSLSVPNNQSKTMLRVQLQASLCPVSTTQKCKISRLWGAIASLVFNKSLLNLEIKLMLKVLFPAELTEFPWLFHVKSRKNCGKVNLLFFKDNNKS